MASVNLDRVVKQFLTALKRELAARPPVKLGELGPETSEAPNIDYALFTVVLPDASQPTIEQAAREVADSMREHKPGYLARMPMPANSKTVAGAVRCDQEKHRLSALVVCFVDEHTDEAWLEVSAVGGPTAVVVH